MKLMRKGLRFGLMGLLVVSGCGTERIGDVKARLSGESYVNRMVIGDYSVGFRYLPQMLRMLESSGIPDSVSFTPQVLVSLRQAAGSSDGMILLMNISPKADSTLPFDASGDLVFGTRARGSSVGAQVFDFHFGMQDRIWVEYGNKKHSLLGCLMTNTWGMTKGRTFTLVLPRIEGIEQGKPFTLVLDGVVPGQGRTALQWSLPITPYLPSRGNGTI